MFAGSSPGINACGHNSSGFDIIQNETIVDEARSNHRQVCWSE